MAALDGKITIERELRPCIVHIPGISYKSWDNEKQEMKYVIKRKEEAQNPYFTVGIRLQGMPLSNTRTAPSTR